MNLTVNALLCTQDDSLARAVTAYAAAYAKVRRMPDISRLESLEEQSGPTLLFMDMRAPRALDAIAHLRETRPDILIIALGAPRSDPVREAQAIGVYATESTELDRERFQLLVGHAMDHLKLQYEVGLLRESAQPAPATAPRMAPERFGADMSLHLFSRALRRFDDPSALLDGVVEGIAGTAKVSRAGLFAQSHESGPYRLQAGLRCLEETQHLEYEADHPLIRWMEIHAHMVARTTLEHIPAPAHRLLLKQTLGALGAEIIIPLFTRGRLTGWLFLGQRSTGVPFSHEELEDLNVVTEHIATTLENAKLYEEVALQKTLAETLFHSIPIGVVAVGSDGYVRWFNDASERMLKLTAAEALNQPVGVLGSRLADHLHRTYIGETPPSTTEWRHPVTHRHLSVQTHRLLDRKEHCLGAVALIHDMTDARALREKQEQLERAAFWTELAASMSHEIRNPLVAIKTFAQLLPQRFDDPDFRAEFSKLVTVEVERLDSIIEQINSFANPPSLQFDDVNIPKTIQEAISDATAQLPQNGIQIDTAIHPELPHVFGDAKAIRTAVTHLLLNAMEALPRKADSRVEIRAEEVRNGANGNSQNGETEPAVLLTVEDNGHGIPPDIKEKVFSPFCTTKARGMGLGLPIAKRTTVDHNGLISVSSDEKGTRIAIQLPVVRPGSADTRQENTP